MTRVTTATRASLSRDDLASLETEGYAGPFPLIAAAEVGPTTKRMRKAFFPRRWKRMLRSAVERVRPAPYLRWYKGPHAGAKEICDLAVEPAILDRVESAIGPDILLWGSVMIDKLPGDDHGWHADVEHIEWDGISAWIALSGVTSRSSLSVVTRSHRFNTYPQKLMQDSGLDQHDDAAVLKAAQAIDPTSRLLDIDVKPGEFVLFAGRTWHEARHRSTGTRSTIVFQYSPPASKIRMPLTYAPPVQWHATPPPCCLVRGQDAAKINHIVPCP